MNGTTKQKVTRKKSVDGKGIVNSIINKLPIELHIPGYQYCGPGTKLKKRLARGDPGINLLDKACKEHDIAYSENKEDLSQRHSADQALLKKANERKLAADSSFGERTSAHLIEKIMKMKTKFGMGCKVNQMRKNKSNMKKKKKKLPTFKKIVQSSKKVMEREKPDTLRKSIKLALDVARKESVKNKKLIRKPRVIPVPKTGGILPLIPIFAGLSALGALSGGAAGIAKAVVTAKDAKNQLKENQRHNETMEAIAMGRGVYLKPHKTGLGLFLEPNQKN